MDATSIVETGSFLGLPQGSATILASPAYFAWFVNPAVKGAKDPFKGDVSTKECLLFSLRGDIIRGGELRGGTILF